MLVLVLPPAGASLSLCLFSFSGHLRSWACLSHALVASADSTIRLFCKVSDWVEIVGDVVVICGDYGSNDLMCES